MPLFMFQRSGRFARRSLTRPLAAIAVVAALLPLHAHADSTPSGWQWDATVYLWLPSIGAGSNWYVPYYLDVGTGDSDLTWQGMVGVGYSFDSVELTGVWRYLDYDLGDNTPITSIDFNGPALGVTFRF